MNDLILHITHTDITQDSRILKQIKVLENADEIECCGIGLKSEEEAVFGARTIAAKIDSFNLFIKPTKKFHGIIRNFLAFFSLLELTLRFFFKGLKRQPDVVHCHDAICLIAAVLIKKFSGCLLVYDAHELESDRNGQTKLFSKITLCIEKSCWNSVDLFITVSRSIDNWYQEELGAKKSIIVLNSPEIVDSHGELDASYLKTKFKLPNKRPLFIYVGLLSKGRGVDILLDLFSAEIKEADLVFLGYGDLKDQVLEFTNRNKNIFFHPPTEHNKVVEIVRSADYGLCFIEDVSLSDFYCLPNKLFEYAFAGVYVLASDFPEISAVIKKYCLGRTVSHKRDDLKSEIRTIVVDRPKLKSSKLTELSWAYQGEGLLTTYKTMLLTRPSERKR